MTVEKLKRVLQRIRVRNPGAKEIKWNELRQCIMIECGTCPATYYNNRKALIKLGWLATSKNYRSRVDITGKDLTEDFI